MYKKEELIKKYDSSEFKQKFEKLFCLHTFFLKAVYNKEFSVDSEIEDAIILTEFGKKIYENLKKKDGEDALAKFFLFVKFYFIDLYIDIEKSNVTVIEDFLDKSIKNRSIIFPWIYRKDLYDKYFIEFNDNYEILNEQQTEILLKNAYYGVFQVGEYICGSLGLKKSESKRIIMPTKNVPLYHCPDPACGNLHRAKINDIYSCELRVENKKNISCC